MKSAIAILTYRRLGALQVLLNSLRAHVPSCPVAVFEDCANFDGTTGFLAQNATRLAPDPALEAEVYDNPAGFKAFVGWRNLGVAGNSNRAIRWFMEQTDCDHLCLCNDDCVASGDFAREYAEAQAALKIGLLCLCDFTGEEYVGPQVTVRGYTLRLVPRQTGIMMAMTRALVDKIGYFDVEIGRFGEEHVDYTNRAKFAGFINLRGQPQSCLDLVSQHLHHQEVASSIAPAEKAVFDYEAMQGMRAACARYATESWYRPFCLYHGRRAGGYNGNGTLIRRLQEVGYKLVVDYTMHDETALV